MYKSINPSRLYYFKYIYINIYTSAAVLSPNTTANTAPAIITIIENISFILIYSPRIFQDNKVFHTNVIAANGANNDAGANA